MQKGESDFVPGRPGKSREGPGNVSGHNRTGPRDLEGPVVPWSRDLTSPKVPGLEKWKSPGTMETLIGTQYKKSFSNAMMHF